MDKSVNFGHFLAGVLCLGSFFIGGTALLDVVIRPALQEQVGGSHHAQ